MMKLHFYYFYAFKLFSFQRSVNENSLWNYVQFSSKCGREVSQMQMLGIKNTNNHIHIAKWSHTDVNITMKRKLGTFIAEISTGYYIPGQSYGRFILYFFIFLSFTETRVFCSYELTSGTFQFINDSIVRVILTRYIPEPNRGKWFLFESSLCSTVDLKQKYFTDRRGIINILKHIVKCNLY